MALDVPRYPHIQGYPFTIVHYHYCSSLLPANRSYMAESLAGCAGIDTAVVIAAVKIRSDHHPVGRNHRGAVVRPSNHISWRFTAILLCPLGSD